MNAILDALRAKINMQLKWNTAIWLVLQLLFAAHTSSVYRCDQTPIQWVLPSNQKSECMKGLAMPDYSLLNDMVTDLSASMQGRSWDQTFSQNYHYNSKKGQL